MYDVRDPNTIFVFGFRTQVRACMCQWCAQTLPEGGSRKWPCDGACQRPASRPLSAVLGSWLRGLEKNSHCCARRRSAAARLRAASVVQLNHPALLLECRPQLSACSIAVIQPP